MACTVESCAVQGGGALTGFFRSQGGEVIARMTACQTESPVGPRKLRGSDLLLAAAMTAAAVVLTGDAWLDNLRVAINDEDMGYVLIAPAVIAWLAWVRRHRFAGCRARGGWIGVSLIAVSWLPMLKIGRKRPAYCNPTEFTSIFRAAPDSLWRALLVVLYTTGLRLREALNLTWSDIDFGTGQLHVTRKVAAAFVQAWTPKDHEMRTIPLSQPAIDALTAWQSIAPESCPYVFMDRGRWQYYRQQVTDGRWSSRSDLVNNVLRRFKTLCKRAGVGRYTVHDLRRSCITNWARRLPIHVVQQLAGHSDIKTTQQFYLSVRPEDVAEAQSVAAALLAKLPKSEVTDPKLTHSGPKRAFPGRQAFSSVSQEQHL